MIDRLVKRGKPVFFLLVSMWITFLANGVLEVDLRSYGIVPRTVDGIPGIAFSPFLHGDMAHIVSNTLPLLILGTIASLGRNRSFAWLTIKIIVLGGLLVWCFGHRANHIGASGLVFGYFGYAVARAWVQRTFLTLFLSIGTIALFSGILIGVIPNNPGVSWEGHLFGLIAGFLWAMTEGKDVKVKDVDS